MSTSANVTVMKRIHRTWIGIFSLLLGLFFAQVEVKASTIGTPDQSFVWYETKDPILSGVTDFTHTQFSYSTSVNVGDFNNGGGTGLLRESGNLATGELRIYAEALAGLPNVPFGGAGADVIGEVGFGDRVFINGSWTGDLPVELSLGLTGSYTPNNEFTGFITILNTSPGSGLWTTNRLDIFDGATIPLSLTSTVMVPSSAPYFDFSAFVWARAADFDPLIPGAVVLGPDAVANFENTARLGITLPSSQYSFSSESTVLLTQSSTSVPEPTSLLLLGCGLVGLAAWRWKRAASDNTSR